MEEGSAEQGNEAGQAEPGSETDDDLLDSLEVLPVVEGPTGRIPRLTACANPVPAGGRLTSAFGKRGSGWHGGQDIAPPRPGQQGVTVHAISGGRAVTVGERALRGHTGLGVLVQHPGQIFSYYGHLASARCREGQDVAPGQLIGVMGFSGRTSPEGPRGTHLHLGIVLAGELRDPRAFLASHGVTLGTASAAPTTAVDAGPSGSASTSTATAHPHQAGLDVLRKRLAAAGYPVTGGGVLISAIMAYQRANGLVADGVWGPITERHYQFTLVLQSRLNLWKAVRPKLRVDGDLGPLTRRALGQMQSRNGLRVTGTPDTATRRRLGI